MCKDESFLFKERVPYKKQKRTEKKNPYHRCRLQAKLSWTHAPGVLFRDEKAGEVGGGKILGRIYSVSAD